VKAITIAGDRNVFQHNRSRREVDKKRAGFPSPYGIAALPRKKWKMIEISARTSKMWIKPLVTWNAVNPKSHITSKTPAIIA